MVLKWSIALLAVFGAFVFFGVAASVAADLIGIWDRPVAGFSAALAVVIVSYLASPSHRLSAATASLLLGAVAAWDLLKGSHYPENYGALSYVDTHVPLFATLAGGILGLLIVLALERRARA